MRKMGTFNMSVWHTVPKRYLAATLKSKSPKQDKLITALNSSDDDLIVIGSVGTGKTHITCGFVNDSIKDGKYAKYITEYAFADLFTLRHSSDYYTAKKAENEIYHAKHYALLVIDEVGKRELTEKQNIELDELISARYDNMLRTIIVSNLSASDIKARIGDRAYDRLRGNNAKVITLTGDSLRGV